MKNSWVSKLEKDGFSDVLAKYSYEARIRDILAGRLIAFERRQVLVSLGFENAGFLPKKEIYLVSNICLTQYFEPNYLGEFYLLYINRDKIILSLKRLHYLRLWERFRQIKVSYMIFYTKNERSTWGGKILNSDGLRFFAPNSHIPKYYKRHHNSNKIVPIKLLQVKKKKRKTKVIASSRFAFLKKQSPFLQEGDMHLACVVSTTRFGLFLNILGVKCLLHISEISYKRIENLPSLYKNGDSIKILITYIDRNKGQIGISVKRVPII